MQEYHCINDLLDLSEEDPELWRELYGYMQVCLQEDDDPALLAAALGDIARARGMTSLAQATGLSRESLYKSLSGERIPTTETLFNRQYQRGAQFAG